jgi:hypothetical protein
MVNDWNDGSGFTPPDLPPNYSPEVQEIIDLGMLTSCGRWDAEADIPKLYDDPQPIGYYLVIDYPGSTPIKSFDKKTKTEIVITDWKVGDVIISNGRHWFKSKHDIIVGLGIN